MIPLDARVGDDFPSTEIDVGGGYLVCGCLFVVRFPTPWGPPELFTTIQTLGYGADGKDWALEYGCTEFKTFDSWERVWRWDGPFRWMAAYEPMSGAGS